MPREVSKSESSPVKSVEKAAADMKTMVASKRRRSDDDYYSDRSYRSHSSNSSSKRSYRSRSRSSRRYSSSRSRSSSYRSRSRSTGDSYSRSRYRDSSNSRYSQDRRVHEARDHPKPNRCVGVFGLSNKTTASHLKKIFIKFGKIEKMQLVMDATTGLHRGFGFIYYKHKIDAQRAVKLCAHLHIHGRKVRVDFSISKGPHKATPGIYMGHRENKRNLFHYCARRERERRNYEQRN